MKFKIKDWEVSKAHSQVLKKFKTKIKTQLEPTEKQWQSLHDLQEALYAQGEWAVLLVLQGMDTAGKDGLIKNVMYGLNASGCEVTAFKQPTELEKNHGFLWRVHQAVPPRGKIGVFNRSYYEDVIVPYVHPEILSESPMSHKLRTAKSLLKDRCYDIVQFEKYLARQGVLVIKVYLHLSHEEQKSRLLARLDDPSKNWKFSDADVNERQFWRKYRKAYDFCIRHTAHSGAPWYIVPADDKPTARALVGEIITTRMSELGLSFPKTDSKRKAELNKIRELIAAE